MIPETKKLDLKWRFAYNFFYKEECYWCMCDFCKKTRLGVDCKVFHARFPHIVKLRFKYDKKTGTKIPFYDDHIYVCSKCKTRVDSNWISCRCSTKRERERKICKSPIIIN